MAPLGPSFDELPWSQCLLTKVEIGTRDQGIAVAGLIMLLVGKM